VRDLAQHLLLERKAENVVPQLQRMVADSDKPLGRLHALCTLDGLGAASAAVLKVALADKHPTVRRHAIRISEPILARQDDQTEDLLVALQQCDRDDPHVRLQLAYSLGFCASPGATKMLVQLASRAGDDPYTRAAVISSLGPHNLADFHAQIVGDANLAATYRQPIMQMAVRTKDQPLLSQLVGHIAKAAAGQNPTAAQLDSLADVLQEIVKQNMDMGGEAKEWVAVVTRTAASLAMNPQAATADRVAAIGLLGAREQSAEPLLQLVSATQPVDIQIAAATELVKYQTAPLLERFPSLSPAVRTAILDAVIAREKSAASLISALQKQVISRQAIGSSHRQRLRTHFSSEVKAAAAKFFADDHISVDKSRILKSYEAASASAGDAVVGQQVFGKHCAACHRVGELGHAVGPDLAGLKNRSPRAMLTAILDPNAAVEDKYRSYNILTVDGTAETGIIAGESSTAIQLQMKEGKSKTILRADVERIQSTGVSLMPEEMEKNLTPADMNHLLAFLNQIGPPPKSFDGNQPITVTPSGDGSIELAASRGRIFGDQIRFETQYQNVGYWGSAADRVEWTFTVPAAGKYQVWLDYACPKHFAGNRFRFNCGTQTLVGEVESTGTWDDYRQVNVGTIELSQATHIAVLASDQELKNFLFDMRAIRLKPLPSSR
jgi:putative heme-binding domain-containing protein